MSKVLLMKTDTNQFNLILKEVALKLIHLQAKVCLAELALSNIRTAFVQKQASMEAVVSLMNLQVWDLTNYPNTIDSNEDWEKMVPYEILILSTGCCK